VTLDTDEEVETTAGKSVTEIFADAGEARFRELEREAVSRAMECHDGIVALGGGAVLDLTTRTALGRYAAAGGIIVFLDVTAPVAAERIARAATRPLLAGDPDRWQLVADDRHPVYEQVSTLQVLTDDFTPDGVAAEIERLLQVARTAAVGSTPGQAP